MQLNEIIEEYSLATISQRTRISIENIEKLVNHDFSGMRRVKALGFISILERDFAIDLATLKKECSEYFYSEKDEEFDIGFVVAVSEYDDHTGGKYSKLLVLIVLFIIGYGAWHFLVSSSEQRDNNTTIQDRGFIELIVNQAQEWMGSSNTLSNQEDIPSIEGVWAKNDTEQESTGGNIDSSKTEDDKNGERNESELEEQIIRDAKEEQKEIIAQEMEKSDTQALTIESIREQNVSENNTDETLAVEVPSMTNETNSSEIVTTAKNSKKNKKIRGVTTSKAKAIVTLLPLKKVWVGYTDLANMKKSTKVIEEAIDFDTSKNKWILVVGHSLINFVIDGEVAEPKSKGKNYFLIENGGVDAISKEEFQKLNKSTAW